MIVSEGKQLLYPVRRNISSHKLTLFGSKVVRYARDLLRLNPFSFRGVSVSAFALYGFFVLGPESDDLVVDLISAGYLVVSLVFAISVILLRHRLKSRIKAQIHFPKQCLYSKESVQYGIVLQESSIPPYFHLNVSLKLPHLKRSADRLIVTGQSQTSSRRLVDSLTFPHRGVWRIDGLVFTIGDSLGFFRLSWILPNVREVEIFPQEPLIKPLPIVAAATNSGDSLERLMEPSGDTFDLRPYSPSDGTRRLLWKVYAKSGNLIVRKPEPATIPDGEVCIYLIADATEEHVAGACTRYIRTLHAADINTIVGADAAPDFVDSNLSTFSAQQIIIQNVWSDELGSGAGFSNYLSRLRLKGRLPLQVVVFVSSTNPVLQQMRQVAENFSLTIVFVSVPSPHETQSINQPTRNFAFFQRQTATSIQHLFSNSPDVIPLEYLQRV